MRRTATTEQQRQYPLPVDRAEVCWPEDVAYHKLMLLSSLCVLLLCFAVELVGQDGVRLPGCQRPLPEICLVRRLWGANCPGCGLTRSMIRLARGEIRESFCLNPSGPLIFVFLVVQIPYRIRAIDRWRRNLPPLPQSPGALWPLGVIVIVMVLQWLFRLPQIWQ